VAGKAADQYFDHTGLKSSPAFAFFDFIDFFCPEFLTNSRRTARSDSSHAIISAQGNTAAIRLEFASDRFAGLRLGRVAGAADVDRVG
jgi:hypothetical protein